MRRPSHPRLDIAGRYLPEDFAAEMRMGDGEHGKSTKVRLDFYVCFDRTAAELYDQEDDDEQEAAAPSRNKTDQGEASELKLE